MSSTALSVYPHLPPTSNLLNSQQRTRLLRSTRKLGAVLGTTPYLLENDTSYTILPFGKTTSTALKRQGSIFTHKQPSSLSIASISTTSSQLPSPSTPSINIHHGVAPVTQSTESHPTRTAGFQKSRPRVKPPPLYLQLNTASISPTSDRLASPLPSPRTTPPTPTTPVPDVTAIRRKRMAKLARHLGEKVPMELVFTTDSVSKPPTSSPGSYQRRRSRSVHAIPDDVRIFPNSGPVTRSKQEWVGEWNRSSIRDVQKELRKMKIR